MAFNRFKILSLFIAGILLVNLVNAQEIPVQLEHALEASNVKDISRMFDERVDITIEGDKLDYSKQQAQVVLNEFLVYHATHEDLQDKATLAW